MKATSDGGRLNTFSDVAVDQEGAQMTYVYFLRSELDQNKTYIGLTSNLKKRFADHNQGKSRHTSKYKPWKLVAYLALEDKSKAVALEKYLKGGSGRAFTRKHLL